MTHIYVNAISCLDQSNLESYPNIIKNVDIKPSAHDVFPE
jgi:hypothetical protein